MPGLVDAVRRIACLYVPQLPADETYVPAWERLLEALEAHSPLVEEGGTIASGGSGLAYLDARGMGALYGSEETWCCAVLREVEQGSGLHARMGLAGCKFAARVAAQTATDDPGYQALSQPDRAFLASLPVAWLPLDEETQRRLRLLGLRTIGRFAALPVHAVAEQFGSAGVLAQRWAMGQDERPLCSRQRRMVTADLSFEAPEGRSQALAEAALRLAQRALGQLPVAPSAWAIRWVALKATTANGQQLERSAWLGETPGPQALRALCERLVAGLQGDEHGVADLAIQLLGLEPAIGQQLDLFAHNASWLRLEQTLQQLARKYPAGWVLQGERLDTDAPLVAERYTLCEYRP